ncbi:hypothetical protein AB1Y20_021302 [Prymnesium parvum]|uniref:Uncharacterized protein n=1 Tax=Prymnesium parvum TaxID=97485 RepID=A0AB34JJ79_PRYPA
MAVRHSEVLSPEGFRVDGRRANEARRLRLRLGASPGADGSAYVELGNTKVLATVSGPHESIRKGAHDAAALHVELTTLPFASGVYRAHGRSDRASQELCAAVRKSFEAVVQLHLYARTQIDVAVCVMQTDGGVRSAVVNAVTLALVDAGVAMEDFLCACSVGAVGGVLLLDPNAQEDQAGSELSIAYLPRSERISAVQLESKLPASSLDEVMNVAIEGCKQMFDIMRGAVQIRTQELLHSRGMFNA